MDNRAKPFELDQQSIDNLSIAPSLSKEYPETGYNFQDTAFLANQLSSTHDDCAFIDTKEILLSETYTDMYEHIQNSINGKSKVVTGEIFVNKGSEMFMLAPILANAVISETEKIVCPLNLTYPPKESHAVAFCMNKNNDGTYNAVILEQHAQNKAKDKEAYKHELDYSEEISKLLNSISSTFDGLIVNTKYNEKPICREEKVCGIVSMEACKRLLESDNPIALAEEGFSLTADDVEKLHKGGKRAYLTFKGGEPMNLSKLSLDNFPRYETNDVEDNKTENKSANFDQYGRLLNPNYDPLSSGKQPENFEQDTNNFDSRKKPQMKFNPETGCFEYADEAMRKIHELRQKMQAKEHDPLESKQRELTQGLRDIGFSEKDMGKTGDSRTGQVTEKHRAIATSQIEDAKQIMLRRRLSKGK